MPASGWEPLCHAVVSTVAAVTGRRVGPLSRAAQRGRLLLGVPTVGRVLQVLEQQFGCALSASPPDRLDVPATALRIGETYEVGCPAIADLAFPVEYGILLLKPDAHHSPLESRFTSLVRESGLDIVERVETHLDIDTVRSLTHRQEQRALEYLSSGPVRIVLVRGPDALERTYRLKHRARAEMAVHDRVYNLIHACDAGNEFALFLRMFFPGFDKPLYRGFADQLWIVPDIAALHTGLARMRTGHPGGILVPVLQSHAFDVSTVADVLVQSGQPYVGVLDQVPFAGERQPLEAVCYRHTADRRRADDVCRALVGAPDRLKDLARTHAAALRADFRFMLCQYPGWSLAAIEEMDIVARDNGFIPLLGSGGTCEPFAIANSAAGMREFENEMSRAPWTTRSRLSRGDGAVGDGAVGDGA